MSDYDHDQDSYDFDDDKQFYEETVYNEEYYIGVLAVPWRRI